MHPSILLALVAVNEMYLEPSHCRLSRHPTETKHFSGGRTLIGCLSATSTELLCLCLAVFCAGPRANDTNITVQCTAAQPLVQNKIYALVLTATSPDHPELPKWPATSEGQGGGGSPSAPPPVIILTPPPAAAACKLSGQNSNVTTVFKYNIQTADGRVTGLYIDPPIASATGGLSCTASQPGELHIEWAVAVYNLADQRHCYNQCCYQLAMPFDVQALAKTTWCEDMLADDQTSKRSASRSIWSDRSEICTSVTVTTIVMGANHHAPCLESTEVVDCSTSKCCATSSIRT